MDKNLTPGKNMGAAIQLKEFHVVNVAFFNPPDQDLESLKNFNLAIKQGIPASDPATSFHIILSLELFFPEIKFKLNVDLLGLFTSQVVSVDEEFMKSPFVKVNAPAILYPYLRAFVSSFMATAGFQTPILPSINFAQRLQAGNTN